MGSLTWLWVLFHVFVAILIKAPLPYVAVVTVGIFRWPLAAIKVSVMKSRGKYKPTIKDGRQFVVDILADEKTIFSFNLSGSFNFWFEKEANSIGITFFKMDQS